MRRRKYRPDTRALGHIGLGAVIDRDLLEELALHTDVITVAGGTVVARAGGLPRQFVAIIDGNVDVTDSSGRTHVAGPGAHIGGAELLDGRPHAATFVTRSDCHVVVIAGRALASVLRYPGVASWVAQHLSVTRRDGEVVATHTDRTLALVD